MSKLKALWAYILAEPTAAAAFVTGVVPALVLFHAAWLTPTEVGIIGAAVAAVLGLVVAFATHHPTMAVVLAALQAVIDLLAAYHFQVSASDTAVIVGIIGVLAHTFQWSGSSSRFVGPARPALGVGAYKPEESPVYHAPLIDHEPPVNSANTPVPISVSGDPSPYEGAMKAAKKAKATKATKAAKPPELS